MWQINITPLTDVLLVLLIIFMITATFLTAEESVDVQLPGAQSSEPRDDVGEIGVTITSAGEVYIEGQLVAPEDVLAAFLSLYKQGGRRTVLIRADRSVDYGLVFHVMDAARLANLTDVALAAEPLPPGAP